MSDVCSFDYFLGPRSWKLVTSAKYSDKFYSDSYSAFGCVFNFEFFPYGYSFANKDKVCLLLRADILSEDVHSIAVNITMNAQNMMCTLNFPYTFSCNKKYARMAMFPSTRLQTVSEETFVCNMKLKAIYSSEDEESAVAKNVWSDYIGKYADNHHQYRFKFLIPPNIWQTSVINAECRESFMSPIHSAFGCEFHLKFSPFGSIASRNNQIALAVKVTSWPENIYGIKMRRCLIAHNLLHTHQATDIYSPDNSCWGWKSANVLSERLQNINEEIFECTLTFFGMYAMDDKETMISTEECFQKYIQPSDVKSIQNSNINNNNNSSNSNVKSANALPVMNQDVHQRSSNLEIVNQNIYKDVQMLSLKMDAMESKMGYVDGIPGNANVNEVGGGSNNNNVIAVSKLKQWLVSIGMIEYFDALYDCGFDDIETVCELSVSDLENDIGITKKGHRIKFMKAIQKLVCQNNNYNGYGSDGGQVFMQIRETFEGS